MILAIIVSVAIGALVARLTKGMNVGQFAFGLFAAALAAIASGWIGAWGNELKGAIVAGIVFAIVSFSCGRRIFA